MRVPRDGQAFAACPFASPLQHSEMGPLVEGPSEGRQWISPKKCCRKHAMGGRFQLERPPPITAPSYSTVTDTHTDARGTDW
jgi:hypothetical protein